MTYVRHSARLDIRWHDGRLEWYDPATGQHIVTFEDERARADAAENRVRELEEELRGQVRVRQVTVCPETALAKPQHTRQ